MEWEYKVVKIEDVSKFNETIILQEELKRRLGTYRFLLPSTNGCRMDF